MSVELIAGILVWGGVGLGLDRWLGTRPWLMGIGVLLGFGAGLYLVWLRSAKDQDYPNGATKARPSGASPAPQRNIDPAPQRNIDKETGR